MPSLAPSDAAPTASAAASSINSILTTVGAMRQEFAPVQVCPSDSMAGVLSWLTSLAGSLGGLYYSLVKSPDSLGWAVTWFLIGGFVPPVGIACGVYQLYQIRRGSEFAPSGGGRSEAGSGFPSSVSTAGPVASQPAGA